MHGTIALVSRPEVVERLKQHVDDLDSTIRELRTAIFEFETARSSRRSLRRDVLDLVAQSSRVLGFEPAVGFIGQIDVLVPDNTASHLLAVLREALSNVARQAGAAHVDVTIDADSDLMLEVVDDGGGMALDPGGYIGNGLRNMINRESCLRRISKRTRPTTQ
jgi:two-component system, NarL family, sensor histidine kinase DevS